MMHHLSLCNSSLGILFLYATVLSHSVLVT